jgi:parallel beta-helix repeat protein
VATDCVINGNMAPWGGGVECREGGSPTLRNCEVSGNLSTLEGGGIFSRDGAAIAVQDSIILGNLSRVDGGGAYCKDASMVLSNCVVAGNRGGGISFENSSTVLRNCTVVGNSGEGGGISCRGDISPLLANCMIWGNDPPSFCGELVYCLTDQDPLFVRNGVFDFTRFLGIDGGLPAEMPDFIVEKPDYHLRSHSPAIDAGTSEDAPDTDIEGTPRWDNPEIANTGGGDLPYYDIGAYEYDQPPFFQRGDTNADGALGVADAIYLLNWRYLGGPPPPCMDAADVNDDSGEGSNAAPNIADAIYFLSWRYLGGPPPPPPSECGPDPTGDALDCASFSPCS